ncbi:MAG: glycoside hydrolase family 99-like domain-containing protein [Armatimonadota bacterium]|nr:glycoside hydrolase family 99-like domain-containing protein [bacterium]MDW8103496.1 glycoside hydrolase family 99-like domain-containing protein [Armatimonadota bacterium]MDW8289288.1 glycoside hydrolase family 99-like domain-containing protein [Armatimonadota bacterium]
MSAVRVEQEWRFEQEQILRDWRANHQIGDVQFRDGAMHFRTLGEDPILEYLPSLNLPAVPHQAIEVEMRASLPGEAEFFWSNTTESPYGGFLPGKSTRFAVRGDKQWHTYRVFPFWQREGRIVRLRFDPYGIGEFSLRAIRIVRLEGLTVREGQREFTFRGNVSGWSAWRGIRVDRSSEGVTLQLLEPDGFFAARTSFIAESLPYLAVRLRSSFPHCTLVFATSEAYGIQQHTFEVIPDGQMRLYNVDMFSSPHWSGEVVMLGIRPAPVPKASLVLESMVLSSQPQGPPTLNVLHFDVEDALPRAGVPLTVQLRVVNAGGQEARGVAARLLLPTGVRLLRTLQTAPHNLASGEEGEWRWQVVFPRNWQGDLRAEIRSTNATSTAVTARLRVSPPLARVRSPVVPPPLPVKPKYPVGVYYFPGWRSAGQWAPITRFPERRPVLGWYREGDPQVADWHIKWAVEHGITFFVYDWYWVQGARQLEHALHEGYFSSRYRHHLQFCLLWANHNPPGTSSHEDCLRLVRHWIQHYFLRPEHLQIDGKPAVFFFSPYQLRQDLGSDGVKRALDAMRQECVQAGLKGLYILACVGSSGEAVQAAREGYDAVTAYNWPHLGVTGDVKWAPFDTLMVGYRQQWENIVQHCPVPLLPPVSGGWDSRPWHGANALVRYGRTPEKFEQHLRDALHLLQRYPDKVLPMIVIEAWNEWGEGSYIEPHKQFGFGYLDAIRKVFTNAAVPHLDLTPADVGFAVPQVDVHLLSVPRWTFARHAYGWDHGMLLENPRIEDGALTAVTAGNDPAFFGPPIRIPAARYRRLRLRMRLTAPERFEDVGQLFWTVSGSESEATSVRFPVMADGQWREYVLNLSDNPRWRGVVTRLRLDPCNRAGVKVQVAALELLP